jgi:signal peptidase I
MQVRLIKVGAEDEKITKEYEKNKNKKASVFGKVVNYTLTYLMFVVFVVVFSGSIYINCTQNAYFENVPTYRVVKTSSMEKKNKKNEYLFDNNLNDQISAFDLILTYKVPKEEDLKLYDIVVYETDGMLIVHRIVGIEEPNESHPNERYFLLQGDAVHYPDTFPVRYSQMKSIYKGERIPNVGSFVFFMQSPAGIICLILIASSMVLMPIADGIISKKEYQRVVVLVNENKLSEQALKFYKQGRANGLTNLDHQDKGGEENG